MFECAHPDYNAPCERNEWVKSRGTDHRGTENLESKGKKQNTEFILATETGTDVSRTQYKRMAFGCQEWTPDGENAAQTEKFKTRAKANRTMHTR